jgi:arylsulfatase A-like enzyme
LAEDSRIRTVIVKGARALRWPAAAVAVGVMWSLAETLIIRAVFNSGPYLSRSFTSALNGRIIFYGLLSVAAWALITLGGVLWRRISGRGPSRAALSRRAVAVWAAAMAWANLTLATAYLAHAYLGVSLRNRLSLIMLGTASSFILVAASIFLIIRLRRRSAAARAVTTFVGYAALAASLACAAASYGYVWVRSLSRPTPSGLPNVVLITLDAWRADAFNDDLSPAIAAFARENGLIFTNARAPSSWTLPSFAGTFTGSYNVTRPNGLEYRNPTRPTWAEVMYDGGYDTFAAFHNPHLETSRFVNRGFTHFDYVEYDAFLSAIHFYDTAWYFACRGERFTPERPGEANRILTAKTLSLIRASSRRPKFIWVHYLDPHYPYQPTPDILRRRAPHLRDKTVIGTDRDALSPKNADVLRTLYKCEVETVDLDVGRLFAELTAEPNTLVIISADHGEEFYEHGGTRHGRTVYDEVSRVPLIVALPEPDRDYVAGTETPSPVSLADVAPSVLSYLGLPVPPTMQGREDMFSAEIPRDREVFITLNCQGYLTAALIVGDKKAVATFKGDDVRTEYYDLSADPDEQKSLPLDEDGERLLRRLLAWLDEQNVVREEGPGGPSPFGDRADLRALGYM